MMDRLPHVRPEDLACLEQMLADEEAKGPDEELVVTNNRAYRQRMARRLDMAQIRLFVSWGISNDEFHLLRALSDPDMTARLNELKQKFRYDDLKRQLDEARELVWSRWLTVCRGCDQPVAVRDISHDPAVSSLCPKCVERYRLEESVGTTIASALARARRVGLPATLTKIEWAATVAHFMDRCAYCGGAWSVVEHATSISQGGGTTATNCVPACNGCNTRKGATPLEQMTARQAIPERVAAAVEWLRSLGRSPATDAPSDAIGASKR